MNVPSGYTALDLIGFTDRDDYSSTANYVKNDLVHYNGRVWKCLIDDTTGITPVEGANWTVWIDEAAYLSGLADVTITNPANGQVIRYNSQSGKWENVGVDSTPTSGSANLVQSGGVATQLANKANSADLATVATSGDYQDLNNLPTLADVATTGQYSDLLGLPTIPTVNNGTLTLQINGVTVETFNANDSNNKTANFNVPTKTSDLTNDSNFVSDANYQHITVDSAFSDTSTNPVQNKVVNSLKETLTNQVNANDAKNVLPNIQKVARTHKGITFTPNGDGTFSFSGTATGAAFTYFMSEDGNSSTPCLVEDYLDRDVEYVAFVSSSTIKVRLIVHFYDSTNTVISSLDIDTTTKTTFKLSTLDPTNQAKTFEGYLVVSSGNTPSGIAYPMIVPKAVFDIDPSFRPYAKTNQKLTKETTGLIDNQNVNGAVNMAPNNAVTQTASGATFTVNPNKTITQAGNVTAITDILLGTTTLPKGTYTISDGIHDTQSIDATQQYVVFIRNAETSLWIARSDGRDTLEQTFTLDADTEVNITLRVYSGYGDGNTYKPMVAVPSYTGPYVPYAKSNKELTEMTDDLSQRLYQLQILMKGIEKNTSKTITFSKSDRFILTLSHTTQTSLAYMGFGGASATNCSLIDITSKPSNVSITVSTNTITIENNSGYTINLAMIDFSSGATIS